MQRNRLSIQTFTLNGRQMLRHGGHVLVTDNCNLRGIIRHEYPDQTVDEPFLPYPHQRFRIGYSLLCQPRTISGSDYCKLHYCKLTYFFGVSCQLHSKS